MTAEIAGNWILFKNKIETIQEDVYLRNMNNIQLWGGLISKKCWPFLSDL